MTTDERLNQKFFSDPDWKLVEDMFTENLADIADLTTIDTSQPAEHVKAELIARGLVHNYLAEVLNKTVLVNRKLEKKTNPFR